MLACYSERASDVGEETTARRLARNWLSSRAWGWEEPSLVDDLSKVRGINDMIFLLVSCTPSYKRAQYLQYVIGNVWRGYYQLLVGDQGLKHLEDSIWRNVSTEFRTEGVCSALHESSWRYGRFRKSDELLQVSTLARKRFLLNTFSCLTI